PCVELVSGTLGEAGVPMPRDRTESHGRTRRVPLAATRHDSDRRERIDVGDVQPPGEETGERVLRRLRGSDVAVRAEDGDARRAPVEAERVGAHDVPLDTPVPPLVDRAEAVDEVVVADVVPAVRLNV